MFKTEHFDDSASDHRGTLLYETRQFASAPPPLGDTGDRARMKNPRHRGGFVCASGSGRLVPGFADRASPGRHPVRVPDSAGLVSAGRPGRLVAGRLDRVAIADHLGFGCSRTSPFMRARMGQRPNRSDVPLFALARGFLIDVSYVKRCRTICRSRDGRKKSHYRMTSRLAA
jgi:hypothetical protein